MHQMFQLFIYHIAVLSYDFVGSYLLSLVILRLQHILSGVSIMNYMITLCLFLKTCISAEEFQMVLKR
jgi:hypothetical protein